jgi:hypothetical protein
MCMNKNLLQKHFVILGTICLLFRGGLLAAESKVAVAFAPVEASSDAGVISQIMQAELSQSAQLMLVERAQIDKALSEMKLDAQGMLNPATAQKLGSMIGARYFCNSSVSTTGNKSLAIVKVIDVETTLAKLAYAQITNKDDAVESGKALAKQVEALVAQFEKEKASRTETPIVNKAKPIPADWKRPSVMVIIPEMHVRQRELIDPAGETEIVKRLIAAGFKVVDSEYVTLMKRGQEAAQKFSSLKTSTEYAASKNIDILLYGEAISERGASVGDFVGCRGRIELKAIRVKGDEILVSDSSEGGATDLAETIAGKKAIKQAANTLADTFLYHIAEKWNK